MLHPEVHPLVDQAYRPPLLFQDAGLNCHRGDVAVGYGGHILYVGPNVACVDNPRREGSKNRVDRRF
jgi:hypothetical protein